MSKQEILFEQIRQLIEYAKYDINPQGAMTEWMMRQIQIEVKDDLNKISDLIDELELLLK